MNLPKHEENMRKRRLRSSPGYSEKPSPGTFQRQDRKDRKRTERGKSTIYKRDRNRTERTERGKSTLYKRDRNRTERTERGPKEEKAQFTKGTETGPKEDQFTKGPKEDRKGRNRTERGKSTIYKRDRNITERTETGPKEEKAQFTKGTETGPKGPKQDRKRKKHNLQKGMPLKLPKHEENEAYRSSRGYSEKPLPTNLPNLQNGRKKRLRSSPGYAEEPCRGTLQPCAFSSFGPLSVLFRSLL